jgi:glucose-6-phosphate-specific signal transduction histidine kinase
MTSSRSNPRRQSESQNVRQRREEQMVEIAAVIEQLGARLKSLEGLQRRITVLDSVSLGLYDEVDKLSKKAPAETVTDLALEQVNDVIRETKQLLADDIYIQRLKEFVPAGDNPQHRDVVVVLRQVRQGLDRHNKEANPASTTVRSQISEARLIRAALEMFLTGKGPINRDDFSAYPVQLRDDWFVGIHPRNFNFERLDNITISDYFETEEL